MQPQLLEFFQRQIEHQCNAALVNISLIQQSTTADPMNVEVVWAGVQGFLTATANISKALWGQSGRFSKQRQPLRSSLEVEESNPLKPTSMRNNFDHFDERLDKWWETSTDHNSTDYAIASDASNFRGLERSDIFRLLNPETGEVVFWGDRYSLVEMTDAIQQMLSKVRQELLTSLAEALPSQEGRKQPVIQLSDDVWVWNVAVRRGLAAAWGSSVTMNVTLRCTRADIWSPLAESVTGQDPCVVDMFTTGTRAGAPQGKAA